VLWRAELFVPSSGSAFIAWRYDRGAGRFERLDGRIVARGERTPPAEALP